jgi:hypothetical protein
MHGNAPATAAVGTDRLRSGWLVVGCWRSVGSVQYCPVDDDDVGFESGIQEGAALDCRTKEIRLL